MTTEEIKKALEFCSTDYPCDGCPYQIEDVRNCSDTLKLDARACIIKQEQEIERLKAEVKQAKIEVLNELYHRFTACPYQLDINEVQKEIKKFIKEIEK